MSSVMNSIDFEKEGITSVIVQGDTTTALAVWVAKRALGAQPGAGFIPEASHRPKPRACILRESALPGDGGDVPAVAPHEVLQGIQSCL